MALPFTGTSASPSVLLSVACEEPPLRGQGPSGTLGRQPFLHQQKIPEEVPIPWSLVAQEKCLFGMSFFMPEGLQGVYATYGVWLPLR